MIRPVELKDCKAISEIYNEYVVESTVTFETEPVSEDVMCSRIKDISSSYPFFVAEMGEKIVGYCYAHSWKERVAYRYTLETAVYVSSGCVGKGIGKQLMQRLIEECRQRDYRAMIACITDDNEPSKMLHLGLGFKQVSHFCKVGLKFGQWLDVVDYELLFEHD